MSADRPSAAPGESAGETPGGADLRADVLDWFIRRGRPDWRPADEQALHAWLAADPVRATAWARWQAHWQALDAVPPSAVAALRRTLAASGAGAPGPAAAHAEGVAAGLPGGVTEQPAGPSGLSGHLAGGFAASPASHVPDHLPGHAAVGAPAPGGSPFARPPRPACPAAARRRRAPVLAAVALAVLAVPVWLGWQQWQQAQARPLYAQDFVTQRGQQADLTLPDGTRLRLDTATRLRVHYTRQRRQVALLDGQALFTVPPDPARPFHVQAGPVDVRVVGTRFSVRHTPGQPGAPGVRVAVAQGRVRVITPAAPASVDLRAGQQLHTSAQGVAAPVSAVPAEGIVPWSAHRVSFVDTPLALALAELERYGPTGLHVRHPGVAALRLSGTFDPREPRTLHRVLPRALPVRLRPTGDGQVEVLPAS